MIHFEAEHRHAHLAAGISRLDGSRYALGKDCKFGEFLVGEVEKIVHLALRHHQRVSFGYGVDVEKGVVLLVFGAFV